MRYSVQCTDLSQAIWILTRMDPGSWILAHADPGSWILNFVCHLRCLCITCAGLAASWPLNRPAPPCPSTGLLLRATVFELFEVREFASQSPLNGDDDATE